MKGLGGSVDLLDVPRQGIFFVIAGTLVYSLQDVGVRSLSGRYPLHEIVFIRSLAAVPLILFLAYLDGGWRSLRSGQPGLQLVRGSAALVAFTCYYLAMAALPLADTVSLFFSAPLFVTALAVLLLGERADLKRWLAVLAGLAGVVIMMRPRGMIFEPAATLAVLAALCYAFSAVLTRPLGRTDSGASMTFYPTSIYLIAGGLIGLVVGNGSLDTSGHASLQFLFRSWVFPSLGDLSLIALCGLLAALGFYFLSQAYRVTRATAIAPLEYIAVPLGVVWGYTFWQEVPSARSLLGMALIVGSGIYVLGRESRRKGVKIKASDVARDAALGPDPGG